MVNLDRHMRVRMHTCLLLLFLHLSYSVLWNCARYVDYDLILSHESSLLCIWVWEHNKTLSQCDQQWSTQGQIKGWASQAAAQGSKRNMVPVNSGFHKRLLTNWNIWVSSSNCITLVVFKIQHFKTIKQIDFGEKSQNTEREIDHTALFLS